MRRWIIACSACAIAAACGPSSGALDETTSTGDGTNDATSGVHPSTSTMADTSGGDPPETTAGATTTTGGALLDPCLAFEPPDCGPECTMITAYGSGDGRCGVDGTVNGARTFCAGLGEPVADTYRSTFFAEIDGETWVAFTNQICIESLPGMPIAWTECSGAPGEPEVCACGCAQDVCTWEAEASLLDACGLPTPCPPLDPHRVDGEALICMLTALRDRTPAVLTVDPESAEFESRVFVHGGGDDAQHLRRVFGGICSGPFTATWLPSELCELQPPEYFQSCIGALEQEQTPCLSVSGWFVGCEETPAFCP